MLFLLSPAKTLDFTPAPADLPATAPELVRETAALAKIARKLGAADLKRLMGISDKLAELNVERFRAFDPKATDQGVQAALAFDGDVYRGLRARALTLEDLAWAQDRLRILSGLYGILRPLDRIQPYRLEMGVKLANPRGPDLHAWWGERLAKSLNAAAAGQPEPTIVNLASREYFGGVDAGRLKPPVLTCLFKQEQGGETRQLAFYAKFARGLMARFAIQRRVEHADDLRAFDTEGYAWRADLSSERTWVFARPQPATKAARLIEEAAA